MSGRQVLVDAELLERLLSPREARRMWGGPGAPLGIEKQCRYCEFPHDAHAEGCPVPVLQSALAQPTPAPAEALSEPVRRIRDWLDAKTGECLCGAVNMLLDGLCPTCHDAAYLDEWQEYARAQAARAEAAEAERDRLREAVANVEELARNWREQAWANDAAGAPRSAADKAISPTLKVCAYQLNKALIPAQKASHE